MQSSLLPFPSQKIQHNSSISLQDVRFVQRFLLADGQKWEKPRAGGQGGMAGTTQDFPAGLGWILGKFLQGKALESPSPEVLKTNKKSVNWALGDGVNGGLGSAGFLI